MNLIYIYALIDPRDLEVRYVGKTNNLKERYRDHVSAQPRYLQNPDKKKKWILELRVLDLKPIIQSLIHCSEIESKLYEQYYIDLFNTSRQLLNTNTVVKQTNQLQIPF